MLKIPKPMSQTHQISDKEKFAPSTAKGTAEDAKPNFDTKPNLLAKEQAVMMPKTEQSAPAPQQTTQRKFNLPIISKLRKIKNIEIYVAIAVVLVMVVIYMTTFMGGSKKSTADTLTTMEENYVREMETKLVNTLSHISGAGNVKAMVTAVGSATLEIAYNIDERTITNGGSTTTTIVKTPVIINGKNGSQPLVLFEIKPQLKGVVIVASGASNPSVRLSILRAVQILVSDPSVNIEVLH